MQKRNTIRYYLPAVLFLLCGLFFLAVGLWNVAASLAADLFVHGAFVALFFLSLFAIVAITYGLFLFRYAITDTNRNNSMNIFDRVHPGKVVGLLAFGMAPLLFIYLSMESREINIQHQAGFLEIRPAFLRYMTDHGKVPGDLRLLVPEYISALPEALMLENDTDLNRWVRYQPGENAAFFYYQTDGIPAGRISYDIVNNQFRQIR